MLTGRVFGADEAMRMGLVSRVVAPEMLLESALETARAIRENSEYGVWMTKKGTLGECGRAESSTRHGA
jgi:enoyl-CoA hydratase